MYLHFEHSLMSLYFNTQYNVYAFLTAIAEMYQHFDIA